MLLLLVMAGIAAGCAKQEPASPKTPFITHTVGLGGEAAPQGCEGGWRHGIVRGLPRANRGFHPLARAEPLHAPGDVIRLDILEGTDFAGTYKVNLDGHINVPYAGRIPVVGQTTAGLREAIRRRLLDKKLFRPEQLDLSVVPMEWAPIQISVSGAVFQPGRALTPYVKDRYRDGPQPVGDNPPGRFLDVGLMTAGGVRPDADLGEIVLSRGGRHHAIDLSGLLDGAPVPEISLMHGDHIEVLSTGCRQSALARPSQITPATIRIFFSNLSLAMSSNSTDNAAELPYGSRLLDGAVLAHCVGGTYLTNASRRIAYINTGEGGRQVQEIGVRAMMADPDSLESNPFLMPNDALACFDSEVTNIRDVTRTMTELLTTFGLIVSLF